MGYLIWRQVSNWSLNWKKEKIKWKKIKTLPGPQFPLSAHLKKPLARPMKPLIARPRFPTGLQAGPVWQPLHGSFPPSRCLCRTGPIRQWPWVLAIVLRCLVGPLGQPLNRLPHPSPRESCVLGHGGRCGLRC